MLANLLVGADEAEVFYSLEARFSPLACCSRPDVILFKDGSGFRVAQVELHCSIESVTVSMVRIFANCMVDATSGYSEWARQGDDAVFIETDLILETVVYSCLENGKLAVVLPLGYR